MSDTFIKPRIKIDEVSRFLEELLGQAPSQIEEAPTGKVKKVYFFSYMAKDYVIRFSKEDREFKFEKYLQSTIEGKDFPLAKTLYTGNYNNYCYAISEKVNGVSINTLNEGQLEMAIPSIMEALIKLHSLDVTAHDGYGWIDDNRDGTFNSFKDYLQSFFSKDQDGFWKNWYELFEDGFLNYKIYNCLYEKMMELAIYCEGRRNLTHTDFHYNNLIINNSKIVGVIDWGRASYLDFIFDITSLILEFPKMDLLNKFKAFYEEHNMDTSNFNERFLCAALCNSLDGMRFWAKFGRQDAYKSILGNILEILNKYGITINNF